MSEHPYEKYRDEVLVVLKSKLEEFKLLNYSHVTEQELWDYLVSKKWRKRKDEIQLHEMVSDIFEVKVSDFISYATVQQLQAPDLFSEEGIDDLKELLGKSNESKF
ncbi:post-transcriptional regulator [Fervidibacillus halotolerans]|uniref:Post-transcriptional regulator n=1 Tax=Fervidibacillus halotolerans TaxID=2980027 RepID=A0A9E8LXI9_9BACI|nr:post-transcriptional regulator [Fervidibacillus halotolerans]WAA11563.1 post-transcriptional regulator [Fervidibacillus halotolerans]